MTALVLNPAMVQWRNTRWIYEQTIDAGLIISSINWLSLNHCIVCQSLYSRPVPTAVFTKFIPL